MDTIATRVRRDFPSEYPPNGGLLFFGVRRTDPVTFVAVPALLIAISFVASYLPARRAARIDPLVSLRSE